MLVFIGKGIAEYVANVSSQWIANKAISESKINLNEIDAIAATAGPGLIVCLTVGLNFSKTIAASLNKPFIAVNHLEGHALSPKLNTNLKFPYLLLLISGGHTQYLLVERLGKYKRLGTTIDDALGEAFDKTAKIIGIEFPGGPKIEQYAAKGNRDKFQLPKPILKRGGCNLSFAGLKTAILRIKSSINTEQDKFDLAASFQKTIEEILFEKTKKAFEIYINEQNTLKKTFVVAGGVAANKGIKDKLMNLSVENGFECLFPEINLCSDNAAMIALVGLEKYKKKLFDTLEFKVNPRWQLDENAKFLKGSGVKI